MSRNKHNPVGQQTHPTEEAILSKQVLKWLKRNFPSSAPCAKLFTLPADARGPDDARLLVATVSVIQDGEDLVPSCSLLWAKGRTAADILPSAAMFYIRDSAIYHVIEVTRGKSADGRKTRKNDHYYSTPKLTDPWKFKGAIERLEEVLGLTKGVIGTPMNPEDPLLNADKIRSVRFSDEKGSDKGR